LKSISYYIVTFDDITFLTSPFLKIVFTARVSILFNLEFWTPVVDACCWWDWCL